MIDDENRSGVANQPVPLFDTTAFTQPGQPLSDARVAIVTTAGLYRADDKVWSRGDQGFRVLSRGDKSVRLGHQSSNFDQSGFLADINVAYPVDRLEEMTAEGKIGELGRHNLSFMGAQGPTLDTIRLDTGPAAARLLRNDGVDVILLVPI